MSDGFADIAGELTGQHEEAENDSDSDNSLEDRSFGLALEKERLKNVDRRSLEDGGAPESSDDDDDEKYIATQVAALNRKTTNKPKSIKKTGGFQSMGLHANLLKAITRKGFSVPTPIQRKTMPLILDGQDVVGMARTGSGKTAAFVIPMIEKLKAHKIQVGTRALVLSPSRELAIQSLKVVKEFSKGTDLRTLLIVGGDTLEEQFSQMASNPDIIIATPGRFLHLLVEMSLDLSSVSYVVFDEADRLFEMGFQAQLTEILYSLPVSRQTLLFSATLPSSLVEFTRAGLHDPLMVRLDSETKISPDLENAFLSVKEEDKDGALLYLLSNVIRMSPKHVQDVKSFDSKKRKRENKKPSQRALDPPTDQSTIIFVASQKEVEYLTTLLTTAGFATSFVYGSLDQTARKQQIENFRNGLTTALVVTDVAARGIDIPMLANVVNYDFPPRPKIFVHRVGRTARAGRRGWSYNLIETSDMPYLLDLQLFLGRKLVMGKKDFQISSFAQDIVVGGFPRSSIEPSCEFVTNLLESDIDVNQQHLVAARAKKRYTRIRSAASVESVHRAKDMSRIKELQEAHPIFQKDDQQSSDIQRDGLLARIRSFRPAETVFEIGRRGAEHEATEALRKQKTRIKSRRSMQSEPIDEDTETWADDVPILDLPKMAIGANLNKYTQYGSNAAQGPQKLEKDERTLISMDGSKELPLKEWEDADHFMSYKPRETKMLEDKGYGVHSGSGHSNFMDAARGATMELDNDEVSRNFGEPSRKRWDRRSKKYVFQANDEDGSKGKRMIVGESGQKLASSFRSGRFDEWKKANRIDHLARPGEKEGQLVTHLRTGNRKFKHFAAKAPKQPDKYRDDYQKKKKRLSERSTSDIIVGSATRPVKSELRSADDVRKQRLLKQKRREKNARPSKQQKR